MIGRLWRWLAGAMALLLPVAYLLGRRDKGRDQYQEELNEYVETRRRIDDADIPNDAGSAREWLRNRQSDSDM